MKKYTAFIIAFVLMLSLCACAKSDYGIIAAPQYPEMAKYPDQADYATASGELDHKKWSDANNAYFETLRVQREYASSCTGVESYLGALMTEIASDHSGKNIVYSPINIYLALGMLAEITDGTSRQQILDLLGENSVEAIREKCNAVWNACYRDTGNVTSIPGSSMWLQNGYSYREEVLNTLAENYYASSHSGEMGSSEYNSRFRNWLNENTRGLLESETKGIELKEDTRLALATTLYFSGGWSDEFSKSNTQKGRFSILDTDGATVECDFMHRTDSRSYFWGEKFSAVRQNFKDGGGMWL
ncbi:MAG: hypothetical protein IKZ30_03975, partial [Oscillospiraceae bacterium]|nr:hypothetical protein [Oscillospiraceae bacterium]